MKSVKLPTAQGGEWWVLVHNLVLEEGSKRQFRPIHAFTFLCQHLVQKEKDKMLWLGMSLENKLFACRHFAREFRRAVSSVDEPAYENGYVRNFEDRQEILCAVDALLNAMYSSLEITALMNRRLHPGLPYGFSKQAERDELFSLERLEWLKTFYDLRRELTHFSSPLPSVVDGSIHVKVGKTGGLLVFEPGKSYDVEFEYFVRALQALFAMLDSWAVRELGSLDPEIQVDILREPGVSKPLKGKKIKVARFLRMAGINVARNGRLAKRK